MKSILIRHTQALLIAMAAMILSNCASTTGPGSTPPIIPAARAGDLAKVKALIDAKADVNARNASGATAVGVDAVYNHLDVVKALIAAGADVNAKTNTGTTPLMLPSGDGHLAVVKTLIAAKADVNAKTNQGDTALVYAVVLGRLEVVKALVAAKADVNVVRGSSTVLQMAKYKNYSEIVRVLKNAGAK